MTAFIRSGQKLLQHNIFPTEKLKAWSKISSTETLTAWCSYSQEDNLGLGWSERDTGKNHSWAAPRPHPFTLFSIQVSALLMTQLAVLGHSYCILSQLMKGGGGGVISFYSKSKWKLNSSFSKESSYCPANTIYQQGTQNSK